MSSSASVPWTFPVTEIIDVHDGDTYRLELDLGFGIRYRELIRLHGVNAPELTVGGKPNPAGAISRDYAASLLKGAARVVVRTQPALDPQSFARWVADVDVDGKDLANELLAAGQAVPLKA